jgi:hypothetical protein
LILGFALFVLKPGCWVLWIIDQNGTSPEKDAIRQDVIPRQAVFRDFPLPVVQMLAVM